MRRKALTSNDVFDGVVDDTAPASASSRTGERIAIFTLPPLLMHLDPRFTRADSRRPLEFVCRTRNHALQTADIFSNFLALPSRIICFSASEAVNASTLSTHIQSPSTYGKSVPSIKWSAPTFFLRKSRVSTS